MQVNSFFYLGVFVALGAIFFMSAPALAQDLFLKKDRGSTTEESDSADKKLFRSPQPGDFARKRYNGNNKQGRLYNADPEREARRTGPSTTVSRNNELDRIQQANIEAAQARAARNAQILEQKRKTWDAERASADEEARQKEVAELEQQGEEAGSNESRDMSNATYLKKNPMDAPKRTFDIFR